MVTQASPPCNWADLLPSCHRRQLRSAISVCPPLRLGAPRRRALAASRPGPERAALRELPGTRTHHPRRTSSRVRKAPGSALNAVAIATCLTGCGRSSRRPASPGGSSRRRRAHRGQRMAGHACPPAGTGLPSRPRRDPRPPVVTLSNCRWDAALSLCDESFGIEPMTYALRGACALPGHALAAPTAPAIALTALAALGLSDDPVHEPVHATGLCVLSSRAVRDLPEDAVSADANGPCRVMSRQFTDHCHM